jgi:AmmeMemoRadiSam system protein A
MHPLVELARRSVKHQLEQGKLLPCPDPLPTTMQYSAGVFVSIKKDAVLRGCVGTINPQYANVATEVIQNAIKAANQDPRFTPIELPELKELAFSVDILTKPEQIEDLKSLNVEQYGLIVRSEDKCGLLLPNLKNIKTIDQQLKVCLKKGNIKEIDKYKLYRFEVKRFD